MLRRRGGPTGVVNHRRLLLAALVAATVVLSPGSTASARLRVLPPDDLIERATAIVIGTVTSRTETGRSLDVVMEVDRFLKGTAKDRQVSISAWAYPEGAEPPDAFPAEGTAVLVALGGDSGNWRLQTDLNAVALLEKGHVTAIHHGTRIGIDEQAWDAEDYARAFEEFYQARRPWYARIVEWLVSRWTGRQME